MIPLHSSVPLTLTETEIYKAYLTKKDTWGPDHSYLLHCTGCFLFLICDLVTKEFVDSF